MLKYVERPANWRFVLVFDGIDQQREAPATLLPALARLSEIVCCLICCPKVGITSYNSKYLMLVQIPSLTTVFIMTLPPTSVLRTTFSTHVHFQNYTKSEFVQILSLSPPEPLPNATVEETSELWTRFSGAVHDSVTKIAARTLPSLKHACAALWPRFTAPILAGTHGPRDFSKLFVAARVYFQDEQLLDPSVDAFTSTAAAANRASGADKTPKNVRQNNSLTTLLPPTVRLLLVSAYLASHSATKHDLTLFSTYHHGRKRRRGGMLGSAGPRSKHRKIAQKLLGAHAFVLERMLAIFAAVKSEAVESAGGVANVAMDCDIGMAMATLASLRLVVRVGMGGDPLDRGGKWRVNVGWEVARGLGRSMGIELEEWLIE